MISPNAVATTEHTMKRMPFVSNAILWAGAIFASAILGGPPILTAVLLPTLAACALITLAERNARCA
jgi:hypothetical protein